MTKWFEKNVLGKAGKRPALFWVMTISFAFTLLRFLLMTVYVIWRVLAGDTFTEALSTASLGLMQWGGNGSSLTSGCSGTGCSRISTLGSGFGARGNYGSIGFSDTEGGLTTGYRPSSSIGTFSGRNAAVFYRGF